jgi:hypothetical protein
MEVIIMKQIIINNISTSYFISESGECYNSLTKKYLKPRKTKRGYFFYMIALPDGSKKKCLAHWLVASAYVPNPDPATKTEVEHLDGCITNNFARNLQWVSIKEIDKNYTKRYNIPVYCFTADKKLVAIYPSVTKAAEVVEGDIDRIWQEIHRDIKILYKGFYWSKSRDNIKVIEVLEKMYSKIGKTVYQYDLRGRFIAEYPSASIAALAVGGDNNRIGQCCRGKRKTYKKYIWRYAEDIVSTSDEN